MRQRIITAAIRRCAFAICKAAADVVLAADRCAMRMSCHLFNARHGLGSPIESFAVSDWPAACAAYRAACNRPQPPYRPRTNVAGEYAGVAGTAHAGRARLAPVALG